ncbi:efflux RND transporter periplasmic adaptor subunit [Sandaracinus amylolyticus]|nr:efflux RND transporter periplasmic adaptor subunit [Sandaracinus amylolyticus]
MRRGVAALVVLLVILALGGIAGIKWSQITTIIAHAQDMERQGPPPEAIGAAVAEEQVWPQTAHAVGTVASNRDVAIANELPGVVARIAFDSGDAVRAGDLLVQLDVSVERANLDAAIANERLARVTADRAHQLVARGVASEQEGDNAEANAASAAAQVESLRATIERKTVRAPFDGRVGIRAVRLGQYLQPGTTVTTIAGEDATYVDFTLPQELLPALQVGMRAEVRGAGERETLAGEVAAIEPSVDPTTRTVGLRAIVRTGQEQLRAGMFVDVDVVLPQRESVVAVPSTAIVHAPYGDSVYLLEPSDRRTPDGQPILVARQTFVRLGEQRGDFVAITQGVEPGRQVVSAGAFKLRNNAPVIITEDAAPQPELAPRPVSR